MINKLKLSQMMYDPSDGLKRFRKFNGVNLAWWHSFKYGANVIWKEFANEVWGPLWHFLYPAHSFFKKTGKLSATLVHMLYVHMAYPSIEAQLDKLLEDDRISTAAMVMAQDLSFLMKVAIPVVDNMNY